jgi:hypothetical protein
MDLPSQTNLWTKPPDLFTHLLTEALAYSVETEAQLPGIVGGLSVALARTFKIIDPDLKNPQTMHWERASNIFDLLL